MSAIVTLVNTTSTYMIWKDEFLDLSADQLFAIETNKEAMYGGAVRRSVFTRLNPKVCTMVGKKFDVAAAT